MTNLSFHLNNFILRNVYNEKSRHKTKPVPGPSVKIINVQAYDTLKFVIKAL